MKYLKYKNGITLMILNTHFKMVLFFSNAEHPYFLDSLFKIQNQNISFGLLAKKLILIKKNICELYDSSQISVITITLVTTVNQFSQINKMHRRKH